MNARRSPGFLNAMVPGSSTRRGRGGLFFLLLRAMSAPCASQPAQPAGRLDARARASTHPCLQRSRDDWFQSRAGTAGTLRRLAHRQSDARETCRGLLVRFLAPSAPLQESTPPPRPAPPPTRPRPRRLPPHRRPHTPLPLSDGQNSRGHSHRWRAMKVKPRRSATRGPDHFLDLRPAFCTPRRSRAAPMRGP